MATKKKQERIEKVYSIRFHGQYFSGNKDQMTKYFSACAASEFEGKIDLETVGSPEEFGMKKFEMRSFGECAGWSKETWEKYFGIYFQEEK